MWKSINNYLKVHIEEYGMMWASIIIGVIVGMGIFSIFVQAPKGLENWLSAIGTIGAVTVSLYLANKPKKSKMILDLDASYNSKIAKAIPGIELEIVVINYGDAPDLIKSASIMNNNDVLLEQIGWKGHIEKNGGKMEFPIEVRAMKSVSFKYRTDSSGVVEELNNDNKESNFQLVVDLYSGKRLVKNIKIDHENDKVTVE